MDPALERGRTESRFGSFWVVLAHSNLDFRLPGFRPNHSFLGEESGHQPMHSQGPGLLVGKTRVNARGNRKLSYTRRQLAQQGWQERSPPERRQRAREWSPVSPGLGRQAGGGAFRGGAWLWAGPAQVFNFLARRGSGRP